MKLNKKQCKRFKNPEIKINLNNTLFKNEKLKYIIITTIKNIDKYRTLILYFYSREQFIKGDFKPKYTIFLTYTDHITLIYKEDGSIYWKETSFDNLEENDCIFEECFFYTSSDENRVIRFCKKTNIQGLKSLSLLQREILNRRNLQRKCKIDKLIKERMKSVPAMPRNIKNWIHKKIMPAYIFYDYSKSKKIFNGFCTACKKNVQLSNVKYNLKGICPECKKEVIFKSRRKRGKITDRESLQVLSRNLENELVIRTIKIYYTYYKSDMPEVKVKVNENNRMFIQWDNDIRIIRENYYYDDYTWKKGYRPSFIPQYNFDADLSGYLYYVNLETVLKDTPWDYSRLKNHYLSNPTPFYVSTYLYEYLKYPINGKNIRQAFGIYKPYFLFYELDLDAK